MLLRADLNWEQILGDATHHGVAPLVYSTLKTVTDCATVPAAVMDRLARLYYQQAALNGQLYAELREILVACARAGIPVLVLKGAAIAEQVYGNIALRPMGDLDLLVRRKDLEATERLLHELGYVPDESYQSAAWWRDFHHHLAPYRTPDGRAAVELHHHILPPTAPVRVPMEDLWRRARPTIAGVEALVLCPEDLLLHLCLHTSVVHQFRLALRSMCDISETIRHCGDEINWEQVRHCARQWGIRKYVYLTLGLARELADAAVPEELLDSLRPDGFDPRITAWARAQIFADERQIPAVPSNLAQLFGTKKLQEKAALFLRSVFPSPEVLARTYPVPPGSNRVYLYYPLRWRDLLRQYSRLAWRLVRRDQAMVVLAERENQKTGLRDWLASDQ